MARYFRKVLRDGQSGIRSARATQEAEFLIDGSWRPLRATQHFTTSPPAFVWDARIDMAPLMPVFVRDSYIVGRGAMRASLLGVYALADEAGKPELDSGALQRFLGEAIWLPTVLLPSRTVSWTPRDERSALVTLTDATVRVTLLFEFDDGGMVIAISGDRYKEQNGSYSLQPWRIQCDEPGERAGMIIPLRCEVAWITSGNREPYWRGRITSIAYQFD